MFVAVEAVPVNAPTKVVDVTDVRPAMVVAELPNDSDVEPIVTLLFVRAPFGMPLKFVPVRVGVVVNVGLADAEP